MQSNTTIFRRIIIVLSIFRCFFTYANAGVMANTNIYNGDTILARGHEFSEQAYILSAEEIGFWEGKNPEKLKAIFRKQASTLKSKMSPFLREWTIYKGDTNPNFAVDSSKLDQLITQSMNQIEEWLYLSIKEIHSQKINGKFKNLMIGLDKKRYFGTDSDS